MSCSPSAVGPRPPPFYTLETHLLREAEPIARTNTHPSSREAETGTLEVPIREGDKAQLDEVSEGCEEAATPPHKRSPCMCSPSPPYWAPLHVSHQPLVRNTKDPRTTGPDWMQYKLRNGGIIQRHRQHRSTPSPFPPKRRWMDCFVSLYSFLLQSHAPPPSLIPLCSPLVPCT